MKKGLLINAKWLCHNRPTGVQRYANELLNTMNNMGVEYDLAHPATSGALRNFAWEQFQLPHLAKEYATLFCPSNMAPLTLRRSVRLVVTLHCIRFFFHPKSYSHSFRWWYRFAIPKILRRAEAIITVSHAMAKQLTKVYPQSTDKIHVIYPGVSQEFSPTATQSTLSKMPKSPFWIFIGNTSPSKNLLLLLEAISEMGPEHKIALAGIEPAEMRRLPFPNVHDRLLPLGHLGDSNELASWVRSATGVLVPSLYESFSFPVVEAMACGTPVIASDIPTHREVAASAAHFLSAECASQWRQAMHELYRSRTLAEEYREKGLQQARLFSWQNCARQVRDVLYV